VRRLISGQFRIGRSVSDADLKGLGFTRLVKRDRGVYENVTAADGESRVVRAGRPETLPRLRRKIRD
jgi:hypothetical protein